MNPMQSPNTGVGRKLCPEGRELERLPEVVEADEILKPGEKTSKEKVEDFLSIVGLWVR